MSREWPLGYELGNQFQQFISHSRWLQIESFCSKDFDSLPCILAIWIQFKINAENKNWLFIVIFVHSISKVFDFRSPSNHVQIIKISGREGVRGTLDRQHKSVTKVKEINKELPTASKEHPVLAGMCAVCIYFPNQIPYLPSQRQPIFVYCYYIPNQISYLPN